MTDLGAIGLEMASRCHTTLPPFLKHSIVAYLPTQTKSEESLASQHLSLHTIHNESTNDKNNLHGGTDRCWSCGGESNCPI